MALLATTPIPYLGEIYALAAAVSWSLALVLFKRSGESIPPLPLNLFKNTVAIVCLLATLPLLVRADATFADITGSEIALLAISGVLGIAVADSLVLYALKRVGVGLLTIAECSYTPSVVLCAWLMLGEVLSAWDALGAALVVSGLFLASGIRRPAGVDRRDVIVGMTCVVIGIVLMAVAIVMVKPILERSPIVPATLVRLVGGNIFLAVGMLASPKLRAGFRVFLPARVWFYSVPAAVLGSYVAMMCWIGGFKYTTSARSATLNQTSTIFALLFARLLLKEPLSRRKILAAALAFTGVLVVTLGDWIPTWLARVWGLVEGMWRTDPA